MRRRSGCCSGPWGRSPLTPCRGRVTSFMKSNPRPLSRPWAVSRRVSRGARDVEPNRRVMLSGAAPAAQDHRQPFARGTRMRIALVAEDYYPQLGGVPEHVHNLALQLNSWGHTATVVSSHMGTYPDAAFVRSEEHTSELQSPCNLVCRLLLEKKKKRPRPPRHCLPH